MKKNIKKNRKPVLLTALLLVLSVCCLVGCDDKSGQGSQNIEASKYTYIFNANGGTFADGEETFLDENQLFTKAYSAFPVREQYKFDGWFLDKDVWSSRAKLVFFEDHANDDSLTSLEVYAKWIPNT